MTDTRDYFISFTSDDTAVATAINTALRDAGFSTWYRDQHRPARCRIQHMVSLEKIKNIS